MIQLSDAGKRYGHKLLFEHADWMLTPEDRVGLVGANGTGKSTLMKILAGHRVARLRFNLSGLAGMSRRISSARWPGAHGAYCVR